MGFCDADAEEKSCKVVGCRCVVKEYGRNSQAKMSSKRTSNAKKEQMKNMTQKTKHVNKQAILRTLVVKEISSTVVRSACRPWQLCVVLQDAAVRRN